MSNLIVKHNDFVAANYNLTLTEIKIIAKLSSMIQKDDEDFKRYTFTAKELIEELKLNNYHDLKNSIYRLISRIVIIKTENSTLVTTFLSSAEYFKNSTIQLCFDAKLKQYLLQLKENFTMYQFENVVALSSVYAIRIYELCKQYEKIKERTIEIEELKEMFKIQDKYKKYNDFKQKVLKIAEREINEKTDINISFEEIKTSRKVTSIKFLIEKKEKQVKQIETSETKEKKYSEEVESLFCMIKKIEQVETIKDLINKLLKKHNKDYIKSNILYSNKNAKTNYNAYLQQAIENDYAKIDREKEIKKEEQKQKVKQETKDENEYERQIIELKKKLVLEKIKNLTIEERDKHYQDYMNNKFYKKDLVSFEDYLEQEL